MEVPEKLEVLWVRVAPFHHLVSPRPSFVVSWITHNPWTDILTIVDVVGKWHYFSIATTAFHYFSPEMTADIHYSLPQASGK